FSFISFSFLKPFLNSFHNFYFLILSNMGRTKKRASTTRHILPQINFSKDFSESKCIPSSSITSTLEKQADASVVIEEGSSMFNNEDNNGPFKLVLPFDLKGHSLSDEEMNHNQSKVIEKEDTNYFLSN